MAALVMMSGDLTNRAGGPTLGTMALRLQRLDPERRRKRLEVIAERSGSRVQRERIDPRAVRIRELIAVRRRLTG
jgi:hypothetical protein